jgi:hypothetical protein
MDSFIVYPENEEQLTALKAVIESMNISFEQKSEEYPQYVIDGVKKAIDEIENGQGIPYTGIRNMLNKK